MVENQNIQSYEPGLRIRDIEENQKLMKERMLLIGKNFIETQEKSKEDFLEIKKQIEVLKSDMERIKNIISSLSGEVSKSARKEDIAILSRQYKMFEPLKFARIQDVEEIIDEKLNKHESHKKTSENPHSFWANKL